MQPQHANPLKEDGPLEEMDEVKYFRKYFDVKQSHYDYKNGESHPRRLVLYAEPQNGKVR